MIAHLRVPSFQARTLRLQHDLKDTPVAVVDHSRVLDASPDAESEGVRPGQFLESLPKNDRVKHLEFDLDRLVEEHRQFLRTVQEVTPLVETFVLGELFLELESPQQFEEIRRILPYRLSLPVRGAATQTGWLARILSDRDDFGNFGVVDETEYRKALQSVKREEIWGLGHRFVDRMRAEDMGTLAEIFHLPDTERRAQFGDGSSAIERIFDGRDPRPLNLFSQPETLSQSFTVTEEPDRETTSKKLKEIAQTLSEELDSSRSLTHQLRLISQPQNAEETIADHVFPDPTDDTSTLTFTVESLLQEIELSAPMKLKLEVRRLVANPETYHRTVQERYDDLTIL